MNELTLEWHEGNQVKTHKITDQKPIKIGRDPQQCDLVIGIQDQAISRLHIEIFFNYQQSCFCLRNLKGQSNPVLINGQSVTQGEVTLGKGSAIRLGLTDIKVTDAIAGVPPTVVITPQHQPKINQPFQVQPVKQQAVNISTSPTRGLKCPSCGAIQDYKLRNAFCTKCGHMLGDAESVLYHPEH